MVSKLLRDITGSVLVEYTLVFPVFIFAILGTVDVTYMLYEWNLANKATYMGVRKAVVSNPVAINITNLGYTATQLARLGQPCYNTANGLSNGNCPSTSTICTPAFSNGACTNGFTWSESAFTPIFASMQQIFPRLTRTNVQIAYQTSNLGYVGQPGGLPLNVTVNLKCMTHQFYFIDVLMNWIFSPPAGCPATLQGPTIPTFASTLQSEDMATN